MARACGLQHKAPVTQRIRSPNGLSLKLDAYKCLYMCAAAARRLAMTSASAARPRGGPRVVDSARVAHGRGRGLPSRRRLVDGVHVRNMWTTLGPSTVRAHQQDAHLQRHSGVRDAGHI
jgi:hypothetical protein